MGETCLDEKEFDDWFIESLKIYNNIHEYQLEHPTKVIEWTTEKAICVAELLLPLKCLSIQGVQGLCAVRDVKVVLGGFSDGAVHSLRTIPSTSWLGFCSDIYCQLWDLI
uniref:Uncharacterized protein n=1 Tax=Oncorhynchus mykiss TaxID=8022 RepID=A0A8K9XLA8_ONCMY